jgi:hypothetical protein
MYVCVCVEMCVEMFKSVYVLCVCVCMFRVWIINFEGLLFEEPPKACVCVCVHVCLNVYVCVCVCVIIHT